jgi:4'-phosphopantetheinyl transferase EntD
VVREGPQDGMFEDLFEPGAIASAFVSLNEVDAAASAPHPELSERESKVLAGLSFQKRRRDWLGGRLAAKRAVRRYLFPEEIIDAPESLRRIEILPGPTRAPEVQWAGVPWSGFGVRPGLRVSISHSGCHAGAVAGSQKGPRFGFDMERIQTLDPAVYSIAFNSPEIEAIEATEESTSREEKVLLFWTAKEAVAKALGLGLSISLLDIRLDLPTEMADGLIRAGVRMKGALPLHYVVYSRPSGEYVLSLAVEELETGGESARRGL